MKQICGDRPMEAAGSMEDASGVSLSPLDAASGADHSSHRSGDYEDRIHKSNRPPNRGSSTLRWHLWIPQLSIGDPRQPNHCGDPQQ